MNTLPCISIRQPWAWFIVNGWKDIENRVWPTKFRGEILIHASAGMTKREYTEGVEFGCWAIGEDVAVPSFTAIERGGIVGRAHVVDCVQDSRSNWFVGPHGFVLERASVLPFVPLKGQLGFFPVQRALLAA